MYAGLTALISWHHVDDDVGDDDDDDSDDDDDDDGDDGEDASWQRRKPVTVKKMKMVNMIKFYLLENAMPPPLCHKKSRHYPRANTKL